MRLENMTPGEIARFADIPEAVRGALLSEMARADAAMKESKTSRREELLNEQLQFAQELVEQILTATKELSSARDMRRAIARLVCNSSVEL